MHKSLMNNLPFLKQSKAGIKFFDFTDILGIRAGTIVKNDSHGFHDYRALIKEQAQASRSTQDGQKIPQIRLIQLTQKHTNLVIAAESDIQKPADGLFSAQSGHVLLIKTADCFPVFLTDGQTSVLVHIGWRGLFGGIIKSLFNTVTNLRVNLARAVVGPGIEACCFAVGSEVALLFPVRYRIFRAGKYNVDLPAIIVDELAAFGIKSITRCKTCTACRPELLNSYRREGRKVKQMYSYMLAGG